MRRRGSYGLTGLGVTIGLIALFATVALANVTMTTGTVNCGGYSLIFNESDLTTGTSRYAVYNLYVTCNGTTTTYSGTTAPFTATGPTNMQTASGTWSLTADCTVTGTAYVDDYPAGATPITFSGSTPATLSCGTTPPPPSLAVTKTADAATVTPGSLAGFTVTITNTGTTTDTGVTLSDPLPPGAGSDINWQIDTTTGNPGDFQITGAVGTQTLATFGAGTTLAAGDSESVHITGLTTANDVSTSSNPALTVGGLSGYVVLYEGTGNNQLSITNDTIVGNIGVGGGQVQFNGPGTIKGRVDFSAANTGQFHSTNSSNVGPTLVNYNVAAVTTAINAANSLSSSLGGLPGTSISFNNANMTITESSGMLETAGGVSYRVFNVTSYSENNADTVTIVGDGSGNPVVFNFAYESNTNLGGQVALTGGLTPDQVIWNFTSTNKNVSLNNNGGTFQGVILLPADHYQSNSSNLFGRVYGGSVGNMQIVSGANVRVPPGPLTNTATVSAADVSAQSATATVSIN